MYEDWYEVVSTPTLFQADLLLGCPVSKVIATQFPLPDEDVPITSAEIDLIVLTQSCDLDSDKVDEVLLAAVREYSTMVAEDGDRNPAIKGQTWRTSVQRGEQPPYCLLPPHEAEPPMDWALIDYHHLFSLPKPYLEAFADSRGKRLRLKVPYREHVAQSFARYMMRVGLPTPLHAFDSRKPT